MGEAWQTGRFGDLVTYVRGLHANGCGTHLILSGIGGCLICACILAAGFWGAVCSPPSPSGGDTFASTALPGLEELLNSSPWNGLLSLLLGVSGLY